MKAIAIAILILTSCGVTKKQTPQHKVEWVEIVTDTSVVDTNYIYRGHQ
jgi:hypothetical protein